ncbi:CLUMA_CG009475, isoform A [Clunio marinus]|uniref:CLUMA_CG009475, isoform A n=1 Tax=Clunio marinus TaxID=568069 RepID=A0A1J1IAQ1_9DIPT|nr:CLUMA_CG009475, isoform A [Clunio marinus]
MNTPSGVSRNGVKLRRFYSELSFCVHGFPLLCNKFFKSNLLVRIAKRILLFIHFRGQSKIRENLCNWHKEADDEEKKEDEGEMSIITSAVQSIACRSIRMTSNTDSLSLTMKMHNSGLVWIQRDKD